MNQRCKMYQRLGGAGTGLLLIALALGGQVWASPNQAPQRQTVPLTPPATWTPVVTPVAKPTQPRPPTRLPEQGNVPQAPDPWLGLSISPIVVAPNREAIVHLTLVNQGSGDLAEGLISLTLPRTLVYVGGEASSGSLVETSGTVRWTTQVAAQSESVLKIRVRVVETALPNQRLTLQADLAWPGGTLSSNPGIIELPLALLP